MDYVGNMCCRLCLTSCVERNINETTAEMSEVYRITTKFFPAKFLDPFWGKPSAVLCLDCWRHIIEFYSFQESIFQRQKNLISLEVDNDIKDLEYKIKCKTSDDENCQNSFNKYKIGQKIEATVNALDDDNFDISLSDLDDIDIQFSSDEEEKSKANDKNPDPSKIHCISSSKDAVLCNEKYQSIEENIDKFLAKYKPNLECWICQKIVDNFKSLEDHFTSNHHRGQCYIYCCQQKLYKKKQLLDHIFCHHATPIFECEICKTHYYTELALKKHHDQKHGFYCSKCAKVFPNHEELDSHYSKHCVCFECKKSFDTSDSLVRHKQIFHKKIGFRQRKKLFGQRKSSKTGVDNYKRVSLNNALKYKCYMCEKIFSKFLHLRDHLNFHNNDNFYDCPHCSSRVKYWAQLERHITYEHPDKYSVQHLQQLLKAEEGHILVIGNKEDNY